MILRSSSPFNFPTKVGTGIGIDSKLFLGILLSHSNQHQHHRKRRRRRLECIGCCMLPANTGGGNPNFDSDRQSAVKSLGFSDELDDEYREIEAENSIQVPSNFTSFQQDPLVAKLRTQLGVIHPIPSPPPINRNIAGLFVFFFLVGVVFDKVWTSRKKIELKREKPATWPQVPTSFSLFLEKDLQRKESVEWVNMVLGKLWKVYRVGLENWLIGLLQPVIDNLKKPDYVERVEIKQFSLGEEPLSVRNVERRTSRRANDLQYQIGLRYTGGARMLLMLTLKFGFIPIKVPVGIRDFDIDGELWVKLRLIPTEPWVGAVSWAFVSLPKINFRLSPFRLFNVMAIPVLSMFLTKLLTEDLPRLFVRPKKSVLDFQKITAVGPISNDIIQDSKKDFVGELSVTLVDARKLPYFFSGKTDPFVVLSLGDQVMRSKKNSQTTVIGRPGEPIWNQDFDMLVANPRKQKLQIQVKDSLGFTDLTIGTGEVELGSLQDTVPTDKIVALKGGWDLFRKGSAGEILLRLTYKAYVEDEEDDKTKEESVDPDVSDDEMLDSDEADTTPEQPQGTSDATEKESFMDVLAALIVSEEFLGIVASETGYSKTTEDVTKSASSRAQTPDRLADSVPPGPGSGVVSPEDSALFWFAVITSVAVLIAFNVGGSSFFNP
ncbi:synaptotagmin-2-like [Papaver somniferum]|uniref:synaptotagmin-2-like n=1 Tax=Papaver somniferum TaxID=3469 RepID=UPI000E6F85CF|nr:synaptotagmin-2-like [Papaver somniferum]